MILPVVPIIFIHFTIKKNSTMQSINLFSGEERSEIASTHNSMCITYVLMYRL